MPVSRRISIFVWWVCLGLGCLLALVTFRGALALLCDVPFTFGQWDRPFRKGLSSEALEATTEPTGLAILFLAFLALLIGVYRATRFPAWNERHSQWLATTPWTPREPLPFRPCTPTWRDLCAVAALDGLLWWHFPAFPGLITAVYLYTWTILNLMFLLVCQRKLCLGIATVLALPLWLPIQFGPMFALTLLCGALATLVMVQWGIPILLQALYEQNQELLAVPNKEGKTKKDHLGSFRTLSPQPDEPTPQWPTIAALGIFAAGGLFTKTDDDHWLIPFLFLGIVVFRWVIHFVIKSPIPILHRYFRLSGLIVLGVFGLGTLVSGDLRPLWHTAICLLGLVALARAEDLRMWTLTGSGRLHFHSDPKNHEQI